MFLKSISINNFKSIQKATVGFERGLNIIIGKNGAGKSNLLQFIRQFVSYHAISGKQVTPRNMNLDYEFTISYEVDNLFNELSIYFRKNRSILNEEIEYSNEIKLSKIRNGIWLYKDKTILFNDKEDIQINNGQNDFLKELDIIQNFRETFVPFEIPDNPYWLGQPNRFEIDTTLFLSADTGNYYDGFNVILELNTMIVIGFLNQKTLESEGSKLENVKEIFFKIFDDFNEKYHLNYYLSQYSPIQEIRVSHNVNIYEVERKILVTNLSIDFKVNDSWMPWSYLSDGSKRLFYLITQCLSLKDGLLLIEEPELGIHPHQLFTLMQFLKEQSDEKQIIISTHSPMVLDILQPDELNNITIAKMEQNGSRFYKLTDEQIALAKEYMQDVADLSDYWVHSDLENNYKETND